MDGRLCFPVSISQLTIRDLQSERVSASKTLSRLLFSASHCTGQVKLSDQPLKPGCFPPNIQQMGEFRCICVHLKRPNARHQLLNGWLWSLCEVAALASLRAKPLAISSLDRELSSLFSQPSASSLLQLPLRCCHCFKTHSIHLFLSKHPEYLSGERLCYASFKHINRSVLGLYFNIYF